MLCGHLTNFQVVECWTQRWDIFVDLLRRLTGVICRPTPTQGREGFVFLRTM